MKTKSKRTKYDSISVTLVFFAMVFVCLCLLLPVWQNAENSRMRSRLQVYERNIAEREEARMILESQVACKTSPEYLNSQAQVVNIDFQQISTSSALRVASSL